MATTVFANWCREDHKMVNPGQTYPSSAEAAQAVADLVARVRRTTADVPGAPSFKTYDQVAVTVP
jgi:hypothetical protein